MCEATHTGFSGWLGWPDFGATSPLNGEAEWIDLSHPLGPSVPQVPMFPKPRFSLWKSMPSAPYNVTEMQMIVHIGTHIDAPRHFFVDGPTIDQIPLDRFHGPGVVWGIDAEPYANIEVSDLERCTPSIRRGDIVLLDTGWHQKAGTESYAQHPCLSGEAAAWLAEQGAKMVGVDFGTPETAPPRRWPGWRWPVHHALLGRGVLVCENLTNLHALANRRVHVIALPLNIVASDGAPARVIARPCESA